MARRFEINAVVEKFLINMYAFRFSERGFFHRVCLWPRVRLGAVTAHQRLTISPNLYIKKSDIFVA